MELTPEAWLSILVPPAVASALVLTGVATGKYFFSWLGFVGLSASLAWFVLVYIAATADWPF
jgi:hypothetical protein